jgi:uncharacterized membrane protein
VENLNSIIEAVAKAIEVAAIIVIVLAMIYSAMRFVQNSRVRPPTNILAAGSPYNKFRASVGRGLLVGLEILVAADIIRTIALEPTLQSVIALGVLVLVRVILGWSITVEIEGRWPWQARTDGAPAEAGK